MTFLDIDAAKHACYDRLHPMPHIDTSVGARRLYDAVCALWLFRAQEINREADERERESLRRGKRRLTRHERHQVAADAGCDTWEDFRGER